MEDTIQLPRVVYAQLQATIMAQAQRIEEFDRAAATLKREYSANFFNVFKRKQVRFLSWKFEN